MADPAIAEAAANAVARKRVGSIAEGMLNTKTLATFREEMGSMDYVRWRRELAQIAVSAGMDFVFALLMLVAITPVALYTEAMMLLDTVDGVQERTMPQMRQSGLLALIRNSLRAGGESADLIEHCVHAGGHILH